MKLSKSEHAGKSITCGETWRALRKISTIKASYLLLFPNVSWFHISSLCAYLFQHSWFKTSSRRTEEPTMNFAQLWNNTKLALWFKTELNRFFVLIGFRKWFTINSCYGTHWRPYWCHVIYFRLISSLCNLYIAGLSAILCAPIFPVWITRRMPSKNLIRGILLGWWRSFYGKCVDSLQLTSPWQTRHHKIENIDRSKGYHKCSIEQNQNIFKLCILWYQLQ